MRRTSRGFGLLEAIVALTLFATIGVGLFGWINQSLASAERLRQRDAAVQGIRAATEWLQWQEPGTLPDAGSADLPDGRNRLAWTRRLAEPELPVRGFEGGGDTGYQVSLYAFDLALHPIGAASDERPIARWSSQRLGVRRAGAEAARPTTPLGP